MMAFCLSVFFLSLQPVDITAWPSPIKYGTKPLVVGEVLYVFDRFQGELVSFDISKGLSDVKSLWRVGGYGQGPGEIRDGSRINHLSYDTTTDTIWLIHRQGFSIYSRNGEFLNKIKRPYNDAWVLPKGNTLVMTSHNTLRNRIALLKVRHGRDEPIWTIPSFRGVQITKKGSYLDSYPELYRHEKNFVLVDTSINEVAYVSNDGEIYWVQYIPTHYSDKYQPIDELEDFSSVRDYTLSSIDSPHSGFIRHDNSFAVLTRQYVHGVKTSRKVIRAEQKEYFRLLVFLEGSTGKIEKRFFHPSIKLGHFLFYIDDNNLWYFDEVNGDKILQIPFSEFETVERLIHTRD